MATEGHLYSISRRKRLIDLEPTKRGDLPLVWIPDQHKWINLELTFGEHMDAVPITNEEAERFMKTGEISSMHTSRQGESPEASWKE